MTAQPSPSDARLRTALGMPLWAAQIITGGKSFKDNPLIGSQRLNQMGLYAARLKAADAMAKTRRARLKQRMTPEDLADFERDGFVRVDDFLPRDLFLSLVDALQNQALPAREMVQGDTITRRIAVDVSFRDAIPGVGALLAHPRWRALTRYIASFDSEPVHYVQTILSHRYAAAPDPQTCLHADTFHPTMKAWLFLTDVGADDGAFTYVPGSHHLTDRRLAWEEARALTPVAEMDPLSARGSLRIEAEELPALGLPPPRRLAVRANCLVVADTFGFHARGPSTRPTTRVEFWSYGRRNPYLPWAGGDVFTLPGLVDRRVPWLWAARDRFSGMIGQPWKDVGKKTAFQED